MCDKEGHPEVQDETTQDPKGEESPMAAKDLTSEAKLHKDEQHAANQPKGEVHTMSTLGKMETPITHPHTPIGQLKAAKAAKAKAQRAQQTQQLSPLQVEPLMLNMRAQRNNMTEAEREYMKSITTEHGGFGRFDYVSPSARFIYRCPLPQCPGVGGASGQGQPINSNGLQTKMQRHIAHSHQTLQSEVHLQVKMRDGVTRHYHFARPNQTKLRKRHGLTGPAHEYPHDLSQPDSMTQESGGAMTKGMQEEQNMGPDQGKGGNAADKKPEDSEAAQDAMRETGGGMKTHIQQEPVPKDSGGKDGEGETHCSHSMPKSIPAESHDHRQRNEEQQQSEQLEANGESEVINNPQSPDVISQLSLSQEPSEGPPQDEKQEEQKKGTNLKATPSEREEIDSLFATEDSLCATEEEAEVDQKGEDEHKSKQEENFPTPTMEQMLAASASQSYGTDPQQAREEILTQDKPSAEEPMTQTSIQSGCHRDDPGRFQATIHPVTLQVLPPSQGSQAKGLPAATGGTSVGKSQGNNAPTQPNKDEQNVGSDHRKMLRPEEERDIAHGSRRRGDDADSGDEDNGESDGSQAGNQSVCCEV